ncbi:hypothetical protein J5J10_11710 [Ciceribacter sp. L1K23]|uniref:hypothetical protein n=1 Tax=unclassified Ciceribacter TaxID=2628820 RepID=UPI001ABDFAEC|nr:MULTISPECIES: hypothetical protein [unclassified Ciceribacter]MBO3759500.1 hypothetical protein [Ciceribacter sp. L1K22]MBR0556344.1 hypothetical protein [Ciceribacter sp. L1K23]
MAFSVTTAALAAMMALTSAPDLPAIASEAPVVFVQASGDCSAAAAAAVRETGGKLLSARPVGGNKCEIIVLVPGKGKDRPERRKVTKPM